MSNKNASLEERYHLIYLRDRHVKNQNNHCYWCDVIMTETSHPAIKLDTMVTIDHIKPLSLGGGSSFLNTCAACFKCNNERANKKKFVRGRDVPKIVIKRYL